MTVENSEFTNNKGINGGAINHLLGELRVTNSKFINNEATAQSSKSGIYGLGGAILTDGANASGPGFGPGNIGGKIIIRQSHFEGNTALDGGGVNLYAYPADKVIVEDSSFVSNTAIKTPAGGGNGGGIRHDNSDFTLSNTSFSQNIADSQGGGLWVDKKSPTTITNSTFSENKAGDDAAKNGLGGGITIYSPTTITNSTFADNYATGQSGAIFTGDQEDITIANSIFDKNAIGESFKTLQTANRQFIDGGNNLQSLPVQEVNNLEEIKITEGAKIAEPKLGDLEKIDGALVRPLLTGSPAIDGGKNEGAPATDARGKKRPVDGDGNGSEIVDIGAYEFTVQITDKKLTGTSKNDRLKGGVGGDTLIGGGGNDLLRNASANASWGRQGQITSEAVPAETLLSAAMVAIASTGATVPTFSPAAKMPTFLSVAVVAIASTAAKAAIASTAAKVPTFLSAAMVAIASTGAKVPTFSPGAKVPTFLSVAMVAIALSLILIKGSAEETLAEIG